MNHTNINNIYHICFIPIDIVKLGESSRIGRFLKQNKMHLYKQLHIQHYKKPFDLFIHYNARTCAVCS